MKIRAGTRSACLEFSYSYHRSAGWPCRGRSKPVALSSLAKQLETEKKQTTASQEQIKSLGEEIDQLQKIMTVDRATTDEVFFIRPFEDGLRVPENRGGML